MDVCDIKSLEPFGIATLIKELLTCIKLLDKSSKCLYKHQYEKVIKLTKYHLSYTISRIKQFEENGQTIVSKNDLKREIFQAEVDAEHVQTKISHIRQEWLQQQHTLANLQDCYYRKCQLLSNHSNYYSMQGSALCSLILLLMDEENALDVFMEEEKYFCSFLRICREFLWSFVGTYRMEPPVDDSPDYKFLMSLFSCLVRISRTGQGRTLLIEEEEGQNFIWHVIHVIGRIKHDCLANLKLLSWIILDNISSTEDGTVMLQGCNTLLAALGGVLKENYQAKLFRYALDIIERLSRDMPNKQYLKDFEANIKMTSLTALTRVEYKDLAPLPTRILRNVGRVATMFLAENNASGDEDRGPSCVCTLSDHSLNIEVSSFKGSVSFSSLSSKEMCDKGVQISPIPSSINVNHIHKRICHKHKKHRKMSSKFISDGSQDLMLSVPFSLPPMFSSWIRKTSAKSLTTGKMSNSHNNQKKTGGFRLNARVSDSTRVSSLPEDYIEKDIGVIDLGGSSIFSQTDEMLTSVEEAVGLTNVSLTENELVSGPSKNDAKVSLDQKQLVPNRSKLLIHSAPLPLVKVISRVFHGSLDKNQKVISRIRLPKSLLKDRL